MKVAVAGGTGVAGRHTVAALRTAGHHPIVIARSTGANLLTGEGLAEALTGVDAIIDATNVKSTTRRGSTTFFETTAQTLIAAAEAAGVHHIVALSIIGIDRVPYGYYQGKLRQEQVLQEARIPVSILRAAQFHEFAGQYLQTMRGPVVLVPRWRAQPVAAKEVGAALATIAVGDPTTMTELAGPQEEIMATMVRQIIKAKGARRGVIEVRVPGKAGQAMANGGGLPTSTSEGLRGTQTFQDWLAEQTSQATETP
jgi:uncharacterized protein YbjT (DUF2867 family)